MEILARAAANLVWSLPVGFRFIEELVARTRRHCGLESLCLIWYVEDFGAAFCVDKLGIHVNTCRCVDVGYCILTLEGFQTRRLECHEDPKRIILRQIA